MVLDNLHVNNICKDSYFFVNKNSTVLLFVFIKKT